LGNINITVDRIKKGWKMKAIAFNGSARKDGNTDPLGF
jgi:hypothetical protein